MLFHNQFYKDVAKAIVAIVATLVLCQLTKGAMTVVIALVGFLTAATRRSGLAACCYLMFPLIAVFNRALVGTSALTLFVARVGCISMTAVLMATSLSAGGARREKLPLGLLSLYVAVACLSSMGGYMPFISYMKIFNFCLMLIGLTLVTKTMQGSERDMRMLRSFMMAVAIVMVPGSLLSYFVPSVGYSMLAYDAEAAKELLASGEKVLFNGMTHHSQMLSPVVSVMASWVLMDMIMIERRVAKLHVMILACVPALLYMSRSRGGLLMLVAVVGVTMLVSLPRSRLSSRTKGRLWNTVLFFVVVMIAAAGYFQMKNEAISRWLRKTDDVASDNRSLKDAFTGSRQQLVDENMADFHRNPLLGMGFQVVPGMDYAYRQGMITWYSASIEKGVTPYVILGETGILGAIAFTIFLFGFYSTCLRKRYLSLMTNFTCFLVANLADSTIFSPSGLGGYMWCIACIGAFSTDVMARRIGARHDAAAAVYGFGGW